MAYQCNVCNQPETRCECERYCSICLGFYDVRLCLDGAYYCAACREVCDLHADYEVSS